MIPLHVPEGHWLSNGFLVLLSRYRLMLLFNDGNILYYR